MSRTSLFGAIILALFVIVSIARWAPLPTVKILVIGSGGSGRRHSLADSPHAPECPDPPRRAVLAPAWDPRRQTSGREGRGACAARMDHGWHSGACGESASECRLPEPPCRLPESSPSVAAPPRDTDDDKQGQNDGAKQRGSRHDSDVPSPSSLEGRNMISPPIDSAQRQPGRSLGQEIAHPREQPAPQSSPKYDGGARPRSSSNNRPGDCSMRRCGIRGRRTPRTTVRIHDGQAGCHVTDEWPTPTASGAPESGQGRGKWRPRGSLRSPARREGCGSHGQGS